MICKQTTEGDNEILRKRHNTEQHAQIMTHITRFIEQDAEIMCVNKVYETQ